MTPSALEIVIYRGEYHQELLTVFDLATGIPVDLTGATLSLSAWALLADTSPLFVAKTNAIGGSGIVLASQNTSPGQAIVTFDPADTLLVLAERALFVLWVVDAAGKPRVAIPPSPFLVREAKSPSP